MVNDKPSLNLELPYISPDEDCYFNDCPTSINYYLFKKLSNGSNSFLIAIDRMQKTLYKIDDFFECLGFSFQYINLENSKKRIKEVSHYNTIANTLRAYLNLYRQGKINSDNKHCSPNIKKYKEYEEKIEFLEPRFFDDFLFKKYSRDNI